MGIQSFLLAQQTGKPKKKGGRRGRVTGAGQQNAVAKKYVDANSNQIATERCAACGRK
jgi:hypothetical protein